MNATGGRPKPVLVVEDNWITRRMVRGTLHEDGYAVLEAESARLALEILHREPVGLILLDLVLPDATGFELVQRVREIPLAADVPVLAFSGFLSKADEAKLTSVGFDDVLMKPVSPSALREAVHAWLPRAAFPERHGRGRRVVIADDDAVQRKLLAVRLEQAGFEVLSAIDGLEALTTADQVHPHAIVSDVLMPGFDGFALCRSVRKHSALRGVPVVLVSSSPFVGDREHEVASRHGATALVARTPDAVPVINAIFAALESGDGAAAPLADGEEEDEGSRRLIQQLERQATMNAGLVQRCAIQAAELSVLGTISDALTRAQDQWRDPDKAGDATRGARDAIETFLQDVLLRCLDVGGASMGAAYMLEDEVELVLRAALGFPEQGAQTFFGHADLLRRALQRSDTITVPGYDVDERDARALLAATGGRSMVIAPVAHADEKLGVLVMASDRAELEEDWVVFARAVGTQLGQAILLARAVQRSRREKEFSERLIRGSYDGIVAFDREGRITAWNPAMERISGLAADQVLGRSVLDVPAFGSEAIEEVLRGEQVVTGPMPYRFPGGGADVWIDVVLSPLRDEGARIVGGIGVLRDTTERQRAESALRGAREQLFQSQKLEALGRLAGGVAHDFNNLLTVIHSYSGFAMEAIPADHPALGDIEEVRRAAERASQLTRQLLIFGRKEEASPEAVDLGALLGNVEKLLRRTLGEDIALVTRVAPDLSTVHADPGRIEQVVMNLAVNARDAMPSGGTLTIEAKNDGENVVLAISDTGVGMSEEVVAHVFEPFFTTKPRGKGTGLGLSTVYGIVEEWRGRVEVDSKIGKGTTFRVWIPATAAKPADRPSERAVPQLGNGEVVLVVEDEAAVRKMIVRILSRRGYRVLDAPDGARALEIASREPRIDVLLSDLVMPGMSGSELASHLRRTHPSAKVLYVSGYSEEDASARGVAGTDLLRKPFTEEGLLEHLRSVLEG